MSSKKEQQRIIREQKQEAAARKARLKRNAGRLVAVIGIPLMLIAVLYGLLGQGTVYPPDEVAPSDHTKGNPDGVVLMIYADFQCPACAVEAELMARAWSRIADDALLVYRHFPLTGTHAHAWTAATYAEAAGRQGHFWEMHDLLFANQSYWATLADVTDEFNGYLEQLGLDVAQAQADREDPELIQKIRNDQRSGTRAGVRGTPTLFVDGRLTRTPSNVPEVVSIVERAAGEE